jgi:hypothetical protein
MGLPVKPYAEACERNREPILEVLRVAFADCASVLEIASGTGQHAVYCGAHLPHLKWQTSELIAQHAGIMAWLAEAQLPNVLPPLVLRVPNMMKRAMRCHDFGSGLEESPAA